MYKGLDNKDYKLTLKLRIPKKCSKQHIRARNLLKEMFPNYIVYEEVRLKGTKIFNKDLYADFFIPTHDLLIEVHGEQHYKKTFFHKTNLEFIQARSRDQRKRDWCELNNFTYIELPSGETDEQWKHRINNRE